MVMQITQYGNAHFQLNAEKLYLTGIAEELDTFYRMQVTIERLVNVYTIIFLQVIK